MYFEIFYLMWLVFLFLYLILAKRLRRSLFTSWCGFQRVILVNSDDVHLFISTQEATLHFKSSEVFHFHVKFMNYYLFFKK